MNMRFKTAVVFGIHALTVFSLVAAETSLSGDGWTCDGESVIVPHTWNEPDGADGIGVPEGQSGHNSVSSRSYLRKAAV